MSDTKSSIDGGTEKGTVAELVIIAAAIVFLGFMLHILLTWRA